MTEALAATHRQEDVLGVVLGSALLALQTVAGAIFLIDETGQQYFLAGCQGDESGFSTIWRNKPLTAGSPVTNALQQRKALFFDRSEAFQNDSPGLEELTGADASVARAVLPMFLDDRPLGTIVLDFAEPHTFTPEERRFMNALAAQSALALGRTQELLQLERRVQEGSGRLEHEARAHETFVAFTEAVGTETDVLALAQQATRVLRARFPSASVAYYEQDGELWKARVWSDDLPGTVVSHITAGVPGTTPMLVQILNAGEAVFADSWELDTDYPDRDREYGVVAGYPLTLNGEMLWLLAVALKGPAQWTEADQAVVRAVGRGLNLALERTQTARQLEQQNADLVAQRTALEAYAELTRDLGLKAEPHVLVKHAQEVVMSMLPGGTALYFELNGGMWRCPVQTGSLKPLEVQAVVDHGLRYDSARILLRPWTSGEAYFQETYGQDTEGMTPFINSVGATATLPVVVDGKPIGILAVALFEERRWSSTDRVVLETVARSLGQALERVQSLAQLTARNAELETERAALNAFVRFTELVGNETDLQTVVRQAITVLHDTCEVDVVYVERDQNLFKAAAWTPGFDTDLLNRLRQGFPLQHSGIALILKRNTAAFIDRWNDSPQWLQESELFDALAGYPYFQQGEMESVLIMGSRTSKHWSERRQGIFRAVGRSLDLALERASQARQLTVQNTELVARTRALEAFANLSVDFTLGSDIYTLIRRAQEVALSLLPSGVALYYEPEGEYWHVKVQTGKMKTPALQATVNAGLPFNEAQSLVIPWTSGKPWYQSTYDPDTDHFGETGAGVGATATLPVTVAGRPVGILTLGFFQATEWSAADRVMLETIARSLSLAMESSRSLHQLAARSLELENERAALAVLTAFTELVASETEVLTLCAKAFEVMDAHFNGYSSVYYEQQDELWKGLAWTGDLPPDLLGFIRSGLPLDFPTFAEALSSRQPVFIDGWDGMQEGVPDTDGFGPVCIYPLTAGDSREVMGLFTVALRSRSHWQDRDKAMMKALGRSLNLTLERTEQTRQLTQQRDLLDARTQLLSLANEDMEAFTYSVSHDLRTPVRHIHSFNDLLRRSLGPDIDAVTDRYLTVIKNASAHMNTLIDAMLDLSRSSQRPLRSTRVDLNDLLQLVRSDLEPEATGRRVTWSIARLPPVLADRETLRQVLNNLLANSLKYTRLREEARIEVWAEDRGGHWAILVRDNGVGFDPKYQDQLFGVFKRLHHERDFEGVGVGLATTKRIVLKHGGEMLAEGRPGEGATFGFTLPKIEESGGKAPPRV